MVGVLYCRDRMEQTVKEGLLYKRGKINTDFQQRLFILNGKQLAYFKGSVSIIFAMHSKCFLVSAIGCTNRIGGIVNKCA